MAEEQKKGSIPVEIETGMPAETPPSAHASALPEQPKKPRNPAFSYLFEEDAIDPYDAVHRQRSSREETKRQAVSSGFGNAPAPEEEDGYRPGSVDPEEAAFVSSFTQPLPTRDLSLFDEDDPPPPVQKRSLFGWLRKKKQPEPLPEDTEEIFDPYRYDEPINHTPVESKQTQETLEEAPAWLEKEFEEEELHFFHYLIGQPGSPAAGGAPIAPVVDTQGAPPPQPDGEAPDRTAASPEQHLQTSITEEAVVAAKPEETQAGAAALPQEALKAVPGGVEPVGAERPEEDTADAAAPSQEALNAAPGGVETAVAGQPEETPDGPDLAPPLEGFIPSGPLPLPQAAPGVAAVQHPAPCPSRRKRRKRKRLRTR